MLKRIFIGLLGLCFFIFLACGIAERFVVNIIASFATCIILLELYRAVGLEKKLSLCIPGIVVSVSCILAAQLGCRFLVSLVVVYVFLLFGVYIVKHSKVRFELVAGSFFITVFVSFFVLAAIFVRYMYMGEFLIWYLAIGAWITDTSAYFTGRFLGSHKMTDISPQKTWEGFVGGIVGSIFSVLAYSVCIYEIADVRVNYYTASVFALLCSFVAQFGDICASAVKREYKIKDYGTKLPGHGGLMDRVDSFLFAAPFAFAFFNLFPIIS